MVDTSDLKFDSLSIGSSPITSNRNNLFVMPQLDLLTYLPQISWLLLIFSSLYYLTAKTFLPRICLILFVRDYETQTNLSNSSSNESNILDLAEHILLKKRLATLSNILTQTKFLIMFWSEKFDNLRNPLNEGSLTPSKESKYVNSLSFIFKDFTFLQMDMSALLTTSTGEQPQAAFLTGNNTKKTQHHTLISDKICKEIFFSNIK